MSAGVAILIIGVALMAAEAWVATLDPITGIACLVLTAVTEAVVASEVRQDWRT